MSQRVPYLDGLRAFAILTVVIYHTAQFDPWFVARNNFYWRILAAQDQGVYLFFVISGFCLAYPTLERLQQSGSLNFDVARFAARRVLRIVPPYWIALALLLPAFFVFQHFGVRSGGSMPDRLTWVKIVEQTFLFNASPAWVNGSFWTLPVEVQWYVACPILIWVWVHSRRALAAIALLCWLAAETTTFHGSEISYLPVFMLGIIAAGMRIRGQSAVRYAALPLVPFAAALLVRPLQHQFLHIAWELAMFFLVIAAGEVAACGRVFSWRGFAPIAAASYSIYLLHAPVMGTIEQYFPKSVPLPLVMLTGASCGVAAGVLFARFAEKPFRSGPIRDALIARLDRWSLRAFQLVQVEPFIALARPGSTIGDGTENAPQLVAAKVPV